MGRAHACIFGQFTRLGRSLTAQFEAQQTLEVEASVQVTGGNGRVIEQVHQIYGKLGEIQLTMSRLSAPPTQVRPGGEPIETALGPGHLFEDGQGAQLTILSGDLAMNVHAPARATALRVLAQVRPLPR